MKLLLILSFLFFSISLPASHINFETRYKKALEQAEKEDKLIFVDFTASWCGPCQKMEREVFNDPDVAAFFNANFINLQLDEKQSRGTMSKYGVRAFPTLMFLTPDKEVIVKASGGLAATSLIFLSKHANSLYHLKKNKPSFQSETEFQEALLKILRSARRQVVKRYYTSIINNMYYFLPSCKSLLLGNFANYIDLNADIEKDLKSMDDRIHANKVLRDRLGMIYFTEKQFPTLQDIKPVLYKLEKLKFTNVEEVKHYLTAMFAFDLDLFASAEKQSQQRLLYGKKLLLEYPHLSDFEFLMSVYQYIFSRVDDQEYYNRLADTLADIPEATMTYPIHDMYSVCLYKLGNEKESILHIQKATEKASEENIKFNSFLSIKSQTTDRP